MNSNKIRKLTFSAIFLALAMVLPFLTGQIPKFGAMLCPMHIPVLLCGFVCGWPYGLMVGAIAPLLRSLLFGMPELFPTAIAMTFELAAYGFFSGLFFKLFPKNNLSIYITLILSMILGRIVWGIADWILFSIVGNKFTVMLFLSGAFITAFPGIILHLILIPFLVMILKRERLIDI